MPREQPPVYWAISAMIQKQQDSVGDIVRRASSSHSWNATKRIHGVRLLLCARPEFSEILYNKMYRPSCCRAGFNQHRFQGVAVILASEISSACSDVRGSYISSFSNMLTKRQGTKSVHLRGQIIVCVCQPANTKSTVFSELEFCFTNVTTNGSWIEQSQ